MAEPEVDRELTEHRTAFRAIMAEIGKVPALGSAAPLARVANGLRIASARDPRQLSGSERQEMIDALGAAHVALMKLKPEPALASAVTIGFNTLGTLALAWAGDDRWTRGSASFDIVEKLALAFQLELIAAGIRDEIAAQQQADEHSRQSIVERLMCAGALEN